jgi:hypothetical protein
MGHHHQFQKAVFSGISQCLHVAFQHRLEGLLVLPFRMQWRQGLHAIEREDQLDIHGVLGPQRSVIVECGNALRHRHEIR